MENIENIDYDELAINNLSRFSEKPLYETEGFSYPAILLKKVYFADIMHVLKTLKKDRSSHRDIPIWIESNDNNGFVNVGSLRLDSELLTIARCLDLGIELYTDNDNIMEIDINNAELISNFI